MLKRSSFQEGFSDAVREEVAEAQHYRCKLCSNPITDFHHRLENTGSNRKLFPVYVASVFNCVALCRGCHANRTADPAIRKPTLEEAAMYEHDLKQRSEHGLLDK